jgi:selenocysteine lyase/cysteine desulfurase
VDPGQRSHILCGRAGSPAATAEAWERLRAAKVATALRGDRIRVSPHLYSTEADVDRLLAALAETA